MPVHRSNKNLVKNSRMNGLFNGTAIADVTATINYTLTESILKAGDNNRLTKGRTYPRM